MADKMGIAGWSAVLGTWVSIIGAGAGGYMALRTYDEEVAKMEDARVVQTFALFEMFNSSSRLESRARLFEHTKNGAALDANDLYVMLDFYDALQICVERNLCDRDLAVRLFQSYAAPFWDELGPVILASRTPTDPNFGAGLQWMASLPAPAPIGEDSAAQAAEPPGAALEPAPQAAEPEAPALEATESAEETPHQ